MVLQGALQHRHGLVALAAGMQRDGKDILIARRSGLQLGRAAEFGERGVGLLEACQHEAEGVMRRRVARRNCDGRAQNAFAFSVAAELPVEIGEIDRGGRVLRAEFQRRPVFGLGLGGPAATAP